LKMVGHWSGIIDRDWCQSMQTSSACIRIFQTLMDESTIWEAF
jgi:hypothetical protein